MIRVRYQNLSPGLHGKAERNGRGTTVYLLPGLTGGQRRAALRRLRMEASRGCGPELPGQYLAVALAADRFRVGVRNAGAVIRVHPAGSLLPVAFAGVLMTLFVLASVSAGLIRLPQEQPGGPPSGSGAPTMVGAPAHAQASGHSGGHRAGGSPGNSRGERGTPSPWWSLAASSKQAKAPLRGRSRSKGQARRGCAAGQRACGRARAPSQS